MPSPFSLGDAPLLPSVVGKDFGLSLPLSLARARSFLEQRNSKINLIAHGRFWDSADCVKAIALGASGVIMDSVLLYGMAADQITKALPWFPIETLLQEGSKRANKLDIPQAANNLSNLMKAFQQEMMIAAHALGNKELMDISSSDLYTTDPSMACWLNHGK